MLPTFLKPGGNFVTKVLTEERHFRAEKEFQKNFEKVEFLKPNSSRADSIVRVDFFIQIISKNRFSEINPFY